MASRELIRRDVLTLARIGFVGCHPGILPDFRGAYASFWAMSTGKPDKIGLSVYLATPGIDTGPLVAERVVPPRFGVQHFKVESERLILEGASELLDAIDQAERGEAEDVHEARSARSALQPCRPDRLPARRSTLMFAVLLYHGIDDGAPSARPMDQRRSRVRARPTDGSKQHIAYLAAKPAASVPRRRLVRRRRPERPYDCGARSRAPRTARASSSS